MQPVLQAETETKSEKLLTLLSKMSSLLEENYSVVNTFASDGERYFHFDLSQKWRRKLIMLQPEDGTVSVINLPKKFDMYFSRIF